MRFAAKMFQSVQATFPTGTAAPPISKALGRMWRDMSREQQQPYISEQEAEIAKRVRDRQELVASRPVRGRALG